MTNYYPTVFGENLMDVFDDFDRNFFRGFGDFDRALYGRHARNMMKTDVNETKEGYQIAIDLPGFNKENIHADLKDGYLTVSTEKTLDETNEAEGSKMIRRERYSGTMSRSFYVGKQITEDDIHANYENGVLKLFVPKKEIPAAPEKRTIMIQG